MLNHKDFITLYKKQSKIMQNFIIKITKPDDSLLNDNKLQCFILSSALDDKFIGSFADKAKSLDKLVLTDDVDTCLKYNLDGVVLDLSKSENIAVEYKQKTSGLKKKFIGVICRNRRHEAMIVSECEPDFVIFKAWKDGWEKVKDLTDWYVEFFLIQSAIMAAEDGVDTSLFKTDFVIVNQEQYQQRLP